MNLYCAMIYIVLPIHVCIKIAICAITMLLLQLYC